MCLYVYVYECVCMCVLTTMFCPVGDATVSRITGKSEIDSRVEEAL